MKPFRLNNTDKTKSLLKLANANNLSLDDLLAIYLVIGDDLFFLLSVLSGKTVKIPYHNELSESGNNQSIKVLECEEGDYVESELVESSDKIYKVIKEPQKILNHWYCVLEESND